MILPTKTEQPFKKRYSAELWERAAKETGIEDLNFHDLRGTAVTMLSEAGCTPQQIAQISRHSLRTESTIFDRLIGRTPSAVALYTPDLIVRDSSPAVVRSQMKRLPSRK